MSFPTADGSGFEPVVNQSPAFQDGPSSPQLPSQSTMVNQEAMPMPGAPTPSVWRRRAKITAFADFAVAGLGLIGTIAVVGILIALGFGFRSDFFFDLFYYGSEGVAIFKLFYQSTKLELPATQAWRNVRRFMFYNVGAVIYLLLLILVPPVLHGIGFGQLHWTSWILIGARIVALVTRPVVIYVAYRFDQELASLLPPGPGLRTF